MILNKNLKLILVFILLFAGIFLFTKQAYALWGVADIGMFDINEVQLDALNPLTTIIFQIYTWITIFLILSEGAVVLTAALLDWAVRIPVNLGNPLVQAGWHFCIGLVNLSFVVLMIFMALVYILRIEEFNFKKTFPKLIVIILLINFSLVLVGALVDVAQIFTNTLQFGGSFVDLATRPLQDALVPLLAYLLAILVTYIGVAVIPYANVAGQVIIATTFFLATGLGVITSMVALIITNLMAAAIFGIVTVLFLLRIVWIWFLAIISPFAFFAYILPQTKKYFTQWFMALFGWISAGLIALFLLTLIINLYGQIINPGDLSVLPGFLLIGGLLFNYLFLIVFLLVVYDIVKKRLPMGVQGLYNAWKKYSPAMIAKAKLTGQRAIAKSEGVQRWGQRMSTVEKPKKGAFGEAEGVRAKAGVIGQRIAWSTRPISKPLGRTIVASSEENKRKEIDEKEKEFSGTTFEKKSAGLYSHDPRTRQGALAAIAKDKEIDKFKKAYPKDKQQIKNILSESLDKDPSQYYRFKKYKLDTEKIAEKKREENAKEARKIGRSDSIKAAQYEERKNKELDEKLKKAGMGKDPEDDKKYLSGSLTVKLMVEGTGSDWGEADKETLQHLLNDNNRLQDTLKYTKGEQVSQALKNQKAWFADNLLKVLKDKKNREFIKENNPSLESYIKKNIATQQLIWTKLEKDKIDEKYNPNEITEAKKEEIISEVKSRRTGKKGGRETGSSPF